MKHFSIGILTIFLTCAYSTSTKHLWSQPLKTSMSNRTTASREIMEINFVVKDYKVWKKTFDASEITRFASGLNVISIGRNTNNLNQISITLGITDLAKAKIFANNLQQKEGLEKAGIISVPTISFWTIVQTNPSEREKNWVIMTHPVKEFNAWMSAYNTEGSSTRAANGLNDVAVVRGSEDANLVHIILDINNLTKVKARLKDPTLAKLMHEAGVLANPTIEYYTAAE